MSRRARLAAATTTAPEPSLPSSIAHMEPAPSLPIRMDEVKMGVDKEIEDRTKARDVATYVNLPIAFVPGEEINSSKSPEEGALKKAVSVQVQMNSLPSTRSTEVQTDLPPSPPLPSPLTPPSVLPTQTSPSPSPDHIPPTSPVRQRDSIEGNGAAGTLEFAGHHYISVTDVEELQEEALVEGPMEMEDDDKNSLEVPVVMENITCRREKQLYQVSSLPRQPYQR